VLICVGVLSCCTHQTKCAWTHGRGGFLLHALAAYLSCPPRPPAHTKCILQHLLGAVVESAIACACVPGMLLLLSQLYNNVVPQVIRLRG